MPDHTKELRVFRFLNSYGDDLLRDIPADNYAKQPQPGMNHPAWILCHLAYAADGHAAYIGGTPELKHWGECYGFGSEPTENPDDYPTKTKLLDHWHDANDRYADAVGSATDQHLDAVTRGRLVEFFPTVREFLTFSLTGHVSLHLGQLSAWRRAMGMPRLF